MVSTLVDSDSLALRAAAAAAASLIVTLALGPSLIAWLRRRFREPIKGASAPLNRLHQPKAGTPTMGGILLVAALSLATALFADVANPRVAVALLLVVAVAGVGAWDDWIKTSTTARGLPARTKLLALTAIASLAALAHYAFDFENRPTELVLPGIGCKLALGAWFVPWAALVIVGSANATNLADGLDGLAPGCLLIAASSLAIAVYASGDERWAASLNLRYVSGAGEATVVAGAMIGTLLGFLWFNCHPAAVFMGDTGSLALGALLGWLALVARQELLLIVIGGVFVAEVLSVIVQVVAFRLRGKRIFLCAPLHHHFQLKGWSENKIVVRFWIAAALCAMTGLASLTPRFHAPPAAAFGQPEGQAADSLGSPRAVPSLALRESTGDE